MPDSKIISRRRFLTWAGIGTATLGAPDLLARISGKTLVGLTEGTLEQDAIQLHAGAGIGTTMRSAEYAVSEFISARSGTLMFRYQNFWPLTTLPGELERLDSLCADKVVVGQFGANDHRVRVLPALARIHGLATATGNEQRQFQFEIYDVLQSALLPSRHPRREVVEMVWQNCVAALVRNDLNWQYATFGPELIEAAATTCILFLDGTLELFSGGTIAWQFLLTYERASAARSDDVELHLIRQAMGDVRGHPLARQSFWFVQIDRLYAGRGSREQMFPQLSELVVGLSRPEIFNQEIVNYAVLARIQQTMIDIAAKEGTIQSAYMNPERHKEGGRTIPFLQNYGFSRYDWLRIRPNQFSTDLRLGLTKEACLFWDKLTIDGLDTSEHASGFETADQKFSKQYQYLYPFRSMDSQEIFENSFRSRVNKEGMIAELIERGRIKNGGLDATWVAPAAFMADRIGGELGYTVDLSNVETNRSGQLAMAFARNQEFYDEIADEYKSLNRTTLGSLGGSTEGVADSSPANQENDMLDDQHTLPEDVFYRDKEGTAHYRPDVVERCEQTFQELKDILIKEYFGELVVIDIESRNVIHSKSVVRAQEEFKKMFGDNLCYLAKIDSEVQ